MRELDALDAEFLAKETPGRKDDEHDHAKVKGIEPAGEKLDRPEEILGQREDREPNRQQLIEVKNQPEGF